mgnify:CR=1 FL=1|tara:strand:- start:1934 stop:2239 length:306 start_codon:yes stop_codon:yes gene_type:complete
MDKLKNLKVSIYADGDDFNSIKIYNEDEIIKGFITNPSLMKSVGVTDYKNFAKKILSTVRVKPIPYDLIKKLKYLGKDLNQFSLDTIKQFVKDSSIFNLKI